MPGRLLRCRSRTRNSTYTDEDQNRKRSDPEKWFFNHCAVPTLQVCGLTARFYQIICPYQVIIARQPNDFRRKEPTKPEHFPTPVPRPRPAPHALCLQLSALQGWKPRLIP